jgi:hypothetical protein
VQRLDARSRPRGCGFTGRRLRQLAHIQTHATALASRSTDGGRMRRRASAYSSSSSSSSICTMRAQHQVQHRLPLDGVVGERAPVLELPARKDEPLLVGRDPLLVLDFALHQVDGVARLHLEGDGLARQGLDKDLHAAAHARVRPGVVCTNIACTSSHRAPVDGRLSSCSTASCPDMSCSHTLMLLAASSTASHT